MSRSETLRKKRNAYYLAIDEMFKALYLQGYIIIARPLCRGYKGVGTDCGYYGTYKGKQAYILELANRCPYYANRSHSNNFHTRIIWVKAQSELDLLPL